MPVISIEEEQDTISHETALEFRGLTTPIGGVKYADLINEYRNVLSDCKRLIDYLHQIATNFNNSKLKEFATMCRKFSNYRQGLIKDMNRTNVLNDIRNHLFSQDSHINLYMCIKWKKETLTSALTYLTTKHTEFVLTTLPRISQRTLMPINDYIPKLYFNHYLDQLTAYESLELPNGVDSYKYVEGEHQYITNYKGMCLLYFFFTWSIVQGTSTQTETAQTIKNSASKRKRTKGMPQIKFKKTYGVAEVKRVDTPEMYDLFNRLREPVNDTKNNIGVIPFWYMELCDEDIPLIPFREQGAVDIEKLETMFSKLMQSVSAQCYLSKAQQANFEAHNEVIDHCRQMLNRVYQHSNTVDTDNESEATESVKIDVRLIKNAIGISVKGFEHLLYLGAALKYIYFYFGRRLYLLTGERISINADLQAVEGKLEEIILIVTHMRDQLRHHSELQAVVNVSNSSNSN